MDNIKNHIQELNLLIQSVLSDENIIQKTDKVTGEVIQAYRNGNKVFFCGNGGSAAEAQHLAAELSGKFKIDRKPLPADACHLNPAFLTAVSNDYDFSKGYQRYLEAFGAKGDILIGLSTSGNSANVVNAFEKAREMNIITVAFTGRSGGKLSQLTDYLIAVPSENVARIQEIHLLLGHIICEHVEQAIFGRI